MSKYGLLDPGTCLPVLEAICHVFEINTALEFGCGIWSTGCFVRNCKNVTSIENIEEWVDFVKKEYSYKNNLNIIHYKEPMSSFLKNTNDTFDIIFIDGEDRENTLISCFSKSPIIICHDTHTKAFNWKDISVPSNYRQLTYLGCEPYLTTVLYENNLHLKEILLNLNNYKNKNAFVDPSFWTEHKLIG